MSDKIDYRIIDSHEKELEDLYNAFIDQAIDQYGSGDELSRHLVGDNKREDQGRQFLANKLHRYRKAKIENRPFLDLLSELCKKIAELG